MRLVDEKPVNAEFLKCNDVIFPALVVQLGKPGFNGFPNAFKLLNGVLLASVALCFVDCVNKVVDLPLEHALLTLKAHGYLFKLAMPDNHRIIITSGDP